MNGERVTFTMKTLENGEWKSEEITLSEEASARVREVQRQGQIADDEARARGFNADGLCGAWCKERHESPEQEFVSFADDGRCSCGVNKHHYHCEHGYISQVG